ncbi:MAG: hypothetical protein KF868_07295 [Acidobacteria bacterium]|nr:hypothetical protein [Acidobacteriota bacterium]MCW5967289.1 hypothetical protein [Blastocatellales bacterium]
MVDDTRHELRIEIVGRNEFWRKAFGVEWEYQYPDRPLTQDTPGFYRVPKAWLEDLERVAGQCFSRVLLAPSDPGRRRIFGMFRLRPGE